MISGFRDRRGREEALTLAAIVLVLTTMFATGALADGSYVPERAIRTLPAIPSQRALISYRNGMERLVVESSLDGPGERFGWILPAPSKPVRVERVSPGLINTLSFCTQPKITHDLTGWLEMLGMSAAAVALGALLLILFKSREIVLAILYLIAIPVLCLGLLPALGHAGGGSPAALPESGVRVEESLTVGSYEVNVLVAEKAEDLNGWLDDHGFRKFGERGLGIVADYIADGWCFVTAQLLREGDGYCRPHPLAVTFPASIPVYPMRLTALNGHALYLELLVAADFEAVAPFLNVELCDVLNAARPLNLASDGTPIAGFRGAEHLVWIYHPEADQTLWNQCVLTKLSGQLEPDQMSRDFWLDLIPARPYRRHLYSRRGAREAGLAGALGLWIVAVVVSMIVFQRRIAGERGRRFAFARILGPLTLGGLLFWGAFYLGAPKTDVTSVDPEDIYWPNRSIYDRAAFELGKDTQRFKGMSCRRIAEAFEGYFRRNKSLNVLTGNIIRCEYSPGNFVVVPEGRNALLVIVRRYGMPDVRHMIPNVVEPPKRTVRPRMAEERTGMRS